MRRSLVFILLCLGMSIPAYADHITGGEIFYTYLGQSGSQHRYAITVKLFMRCSSHREFNNPGIISVFNASTNERITDYTVPLNRIETLNLNNTNVCITDPPPVCFEVGYYQFEAALPASPNGYVITAHVVFRVDGMNNLTPNYNQVGATYTGVIPGNGAVDNAPVNNSARFTGDDLVIMCANNSFSYSFGAADPDGDQLRYALCNAYQTSGLSPGNNNTPPPQPPYNSVPYGNGYSGSTPLGQQVSIDPNTGVITGVAPASGIYVVTVCVEEIRNGEVIASQRKDIQINIAPCTIAGASLPPEYMVCGGETQTLSVANLSNSPLITSYSWKFINDNDDVVFTTADARATYTFALPGTYTIRLVVNENGQCADSISATAFVYPGFRPDFASSGSCINGPVTFSDATTTAFGNVTGWSWSFGEQSADDDHAIIREPSYTYRTTGSKTIQLIVENSVGCRDTVTRSVNIIDKPPITLAYRDTLICPPDALQLRASGDGVFSWLPLQNIMNEGTATPVVAPVATSKYFVRLDRDGCINTDSVIIRVVDRVSLTVMNDTTICFGDQLVLSTESNGLRYEWSHPGDLEDANSAAPLAQPASDLNLYRVTAFISSCTASEDIQVLTVPYPIANAGADTTICFATTAQLNASTDGSSFTWMPDRALESVNRRDPLVQPLQTSSFVFYAFDNRGCPKPGIDTVVVRVLDRIQPHAGADTSVVVGQPLKLRASGGTRYSWIPSPSLSATDIPDPVAMFLEAGSPNEHPFKVMVYNEAGCVDSASFMVRVFSSDPDVFVPSAFTPNGDGLNDYFRPVAAGIGSVNLFRIYNRWGQLVYDNASSHSLGWDGSVNGRAQSSGTFVWLLRAIDFNGRIIQKKGTVTLVR